MCVWCVCVCVCVCVYVCVCNAYADGPCLVQLDPNCNNGLEKESVICMLPGEYEVYDRIRPGCKFEVTVRAVEAHSVTLNAMGQTSIVGVGRTPM